MVNLLIKHAEAYSQETFQCRSCGQSFQAEVITWVDVSKTLQAKQALLKWEFNQIQCTHCGFRHFSGTPFFYEDFEEGLLVAVFPSIPEQRGEVEKTIKAKYGYYPVLEFFYDMTQIWMLIYFQEQYRINKNGNEYSQIGLGEKRLRKTLGFLKEDPLMLTIREKLTENLLGYATRDDLEDILSQAYCTVEEMLPWPRDCRCICGADLSAPLCCGKPITMKEHEHLLFPHYVIYCPVCKEPFSKVSCSACGRVYTWKLGTIATNQDEEAPSPAPTKPQPEHQSQTQGA